MRKLGTRLGNPTREGDISSIFGSSVIFPGNVADRYEILDKFYCELREMNVAFDETIKYPPDGVGEHGDKVIVLSLGHMRLKTQINLSSIDRLFNSHGIDATGAVVEAAIVQLNRELKEILLLMINAGDKRIFELFSFGMIDELNDEYPDIANKLAAMR